MHTGLYGLKWYCSSQRGNLLGRKWNTDDSRRTWIAKAPDKTLNLYIYLFVPLLRRVESQVCGTYLGFIISLIVVVRRFDAAVRMFERYPDTLQKTGYLCCRALPSSHLGVKCCHLIDFFQLIQLVRQWYAEKRWRSVLVPWSVFWVAVQLKVEVPELLVMGNIDLNGSVSFCSILSSTRYALVIRCLDLKRILVVFTNFATCWLSLLVSTYE